MYENFTKYLKQFVFKLCGLRKLGDICFILVNCVIIFTISVIWQSRAGWKSATWCRIAITHKLQKMMKNRRKWKKKISSFLDDEMLLLKATKKTLECTFW